MNEKDFYKLFEAIPQMLRIGLRKWQPQVTQEFCTDFWSINLFDYNVELYLEGKKIIVTPGSYCIMPPGTSRKFKFTETCTQRYIHFSPSESVLSQVQIGKLNHNYPQLLRSFDNCFNASQLNPKKGFPYTWSLLWEIYDNLNSSTNSSHPAVINTIKYIHRNLDLTLSVANLAKKQNISHNQLTRLFKEQTGETVIAYIRKTRAKEANSLIKTTSLSIKEIAHMVGISNLSAFNKLTQSIYGCSPRQLRQ